MANKKPLSVDEGVKLNKKDSAVTYNARNEGMVYNNNNTELNVQIGGADRALVTKDQNQTLTNKTINADNNIITNLEVENLKAGVLDTDLSDVSASDDTIPSAKATKSYSDTLVSTHNSQTAAHGVTGAIVGTTDTQSLTNKTIDSDLNTITNIVNANIKANAAIDATKIHDGNVNNDEFSYLNGVTSSIQSQLNTKALDSTVVHNTGNENVAGVKTFTDTTESTTKDTGAVIIEGGLGVEKNLNVGGNVVVTGNLQVDGTYTAVNSTNMEVTDPNIILNNGGNQASANSATAGFTVEMSDATDAVFGYDSTLASKFKCGETGSLKEIADVSSIQSLTNKTLSGASIQSPVRADVKKDTKANLETYALTASDGQLCFATDEQKMYQIVNNALTVVGGGIGSVDVWAVVEGIDDVDTDSSNLVGGATATESTDAILFTTGTTDGAYYVTKGYAPEIIIRDQNYFSFLGSVSNSSIFTMVVQGYTGTVWEDIDGATTVEPLNASDRAGGLIVFDKGTYTQFRIKVTQSGTTAGYTFALSRGEWTDDYFKSVEFSDSGENISLIGYDSKSGNYVKFDGENSLMMQNYGSVITFDSASGYTKIIALKDCNLTAITNLSYSSVSNYFMRIDVFSSAGSTIQTGYEYYNTSYQSATETVGLRKGEWIAVYTTGSPRTDEDSMQIFSITATPIGTSKGIVAAAEVDLSQYQYPQYDLKALGLVTGVTSVEYATATPYKDSIGNWRIRLNVSVSFDTLSATKEVVISGILFNSFTPNGSQYGFPLAGNGIESGVATKLKLFCSALLNSNIVRLAANGNINRVEFSGDAPIQYKPTWATQPTIKPATVIAPVAVVKKQWLKFYGLASSMTSIVAGVLRWGALEKTGDELLVYDNSTGYFTAAQDCIVYSTMSTRSASINTNYIYINNQQSGRTVTQPNNHGSCSADGIVRKGELVYFSSAGTLDTVQYQYMTIVATAIDTAHIATNKEEIHKHATYLSSTETEAGYCEFTGKKIYKRGIYFPAAITSTQDVVTIGENLQIVDPIGEYTGATPHTIIRGITDNGTNTGYCWLAYYASTGLLRVLVSGTFGFPAGTRFEIKYIKP